MVATSHPSRVVVPFAFVVFCLVSVSSYSLTDDQCKAAVQDIVKVLRAGPTKEAVVKGTWVSPRCEVRRIQDPKGSGQMFSSLLRMIDITGRRKWTGNYFFYRDQDCREATYGLEMHGQLSTKTYDDKITFNFTTVKIAIYRQDINKTFQENFEQACSGESMIPTGQTHMNTHVYSVGDIGARIECLKALGIDQTEFGDAYFQKHFLKQTTIEELFQQTAYLRRGSKKSAPKSYQWPLRRHNSQLCLTCTKIGAASLKYPPMLYARNDSIIDGTWGSSHCHTVGNRISTSRFDKFSGQSFESIIYIHSYPRCDDLMYSLRLKGTIRKVSDSSVVPGGAVYEMTINEAFLTAYTIHVARVLGRAGPGECGKGTWEKGKTQDLVPTKGCTTIGYTLGPPALVLIRTVQDENRNEMFFGMDSGAKQHKAGPVNYNYVSQDCSKFPVAMTTPSPKVEPTTAPAELTTTEKEVVETEEASTIVMEQLEVANTPNSGCSRLFAVLPLLFYLLGLLHVLRLF